MACAPGQPFLCAVDAHMVCSCACLVIAVHGTVLQGLHAKLMRCTRMLDVAKLLRCPVLCCAVLPS